MCALDGSVEVLCILLVTTNGAPDVPRGWLTRVCVWKGIAPQIEFVFCEENTAFFRNTVWNHSHHPPAAPQGIRCSQMVLPIKGTSWDAPLCMAFVVFFFMT